MLKTILISALAVVAAAGIGVGVYAYTRSNDGNTGGNTGADTEESSSSEASGTTGGSSSEHEHDYIAAVTPPTCTEQGYTTYTCSCGDSYTDGYTNATGHTYGEAAFSWNSDHSSATAAFTCSACGGTEEVEADVTSRTIAETTCTENGAATYTATVTFDGVTYTETKTKAIAATGHTYESGACTTCGNTEVTTASEGLAYTLSSDKTYYTVSGIGECTDTDIVIPSTYNGLPVTAIANEAFLRKTQLTSVYIPDSVTSIGYNAFYRCTSLTSVTLCNGLTYIDYGAFAYCFSLTSISIPVSVTHIGREAFLFNALASVIIPENVAYIGEGAFAYSDTFTDSGTLTSITVDSDNTYYKSIDGNLYSYDGTVLVQYATGKTETSFTIPSTVTTIGGEAFTYCYSLESVIIPDSVTYISNYAFECCYNLSSVTMGSGVTYIGYGAFCYCTALTSITIPGSVTYIENEAFQGCFSLTSITIPESVTYIGYWLFENCYSLESVIFEDAEGWYVTSIYDEEDLTSIDVTDASQNAEYFMYYYSEYYWIKWHVYGTPTFTWESDYSAAAATFICTDCGDTQEVEAVITYETTATCTDDGETVYTATVIFYGVEYTDTKTEATAARHTYNGYTYDEDSHWQVCTACGDETEHESHTYENGVCTVCGYEENTSAGLAYTLSSDKTYYTLSGIGDCTDTDIVIPSTYNGLAVTAIANEAFRWNRAITSVYIPDSVTYIGEEAFAYCFPLASVTMAGGVTYIGNKAFYNCYLIESVTLPGSVTHIGDEAFSYCSLTSVTLPESVAYIGEGAFSYCSFTSVIIPGSVTYIGGGAFASKGTLTSITVDSGNTYCKVIDNNLYSYDGTVLIQYAAGKTETSFTIPSTVTAIGGYAFVCSGLESVTIPSTVTYIDGRAFGACSSLKDITIPDSVTYIGEEAFLECNSLTNVTMGSSVTYIGYSAFNRCTSLESITISESVTYIGVYAFAYCDSLTSIVIPVSVTDIGDAAFEGTGIENVYYTGTADDWANISMDGETGNPNSTANPASHGGTLYCYAENDGTTTAAGNYWYYDNNEIVTWTITE